MRRVLLALVVLAALALGLFAAGQAGFGPVVITQEDEQKIILTLGSPRKVTEPGPDLRVPLLETVRTYDRRILYFNTDPSEIPTKDQERIVVDAYVVWRIGEPVQFYSSFPIGMAQAEPQIDRMVKAGVREVIGQHTLKEVLTGARVEIMQAITQRAAERLAEYGIEVEDVRMNRTELPPATEKNVYARMQAERQRLARKYRAEGEEKARRIRAEADREARVIVAEARREAEIARGTGDAEATRIYAEAYETNPGFYIFRRSLEAYGKTIGPNTTLVLSPDAEFFRFLRSSDAAGGRD